MCGCRSCCAPPAACDRRCLQNKIGWVGEWVGGGILGRGCRRVDVDVSLLLCTHCERETLLTKQDWLGEWVGGIILGRGVDVWM